MTTVLLPLGDGAGRDIWTVQAGDREFAVFRVDGRLYVTDARCPHNRGPLAEGTVRDGKVICPRHSIAFELADGRCPATPAYRLGCYPVVERDGVLLAEIPDAAGGAGPAAPEPSTRGRC